MGERVQRGCYIEGSRVKVHFKDMLVWMELLRGARIVLPLNPGSRALMG